MTKFLMPSPKLVQDDLIPESARDGSVREYLTREEGASRRTWGGWVRIKSGITIGSVSPLEWTCVSRSADETDRLGRLIGHALRGGEIIALHGNLGAGKTVLVRGMATSLGAPPEAVTSPTFVLIQTYAGRLPLAHADLYRLESRAEIDGLGLEEYADGRTVLAVEWAEKAGMELPTDRLDIHLAHETPASRSIRFHAGGALSRSLLHRIMNGGAEHA